MPAMTLNMFTPLPSRGLLRLRGSQSKEFLQKLITQDVARLCPQTPLYAALLRPDGRYLADFFLIQTADGLYLDVLKEQLGFLVTHLRRYCLREDVSFDPLEAFEVWALEHKAGESHGDLKTPPLPLPEALLPEALSAVVCYPDPRLQAMGWRLVVPRSLVPLLVPYGIGSEESYQQLRLQNGLSEAPTDLVEGKSILLEHGFHELGGLSWTKGCYIGQELMARTFHRGQLHKRAVPVTISGPSPSPGTPVFHAEEKVGEMLGSLGSQGMILARLEGLNPCLQQGAPLKAGDSVLTPYRPGWMTLGFET
jgi:folate-binding protein YgfZ